MIASREGGAPDRLFAGRAGRNWLLCALLSLLLLWPAAMFGRPGYIADSAAYYHGGSKAMAFITRHFDTPATAPAGKSTATGDQAKGDQAKKDDGTQAVRSIVYSVFTFVLSAPHATLLALVIAHALLTSIMIVLFLRATGLDRDRRQVMLLTGVLLLGTALPSFVTLATPDILSGLTILGLTLLALHASQLSLVERLGVTGITGFSIAAHTSHMLVALGMGVLILLHALWSVRGSGWRHALVQPLWSFGAIGLGIVLVMASALVGFGEVSVAPKRYPFALARSIEDGPARWYLEEHCPTRHYTVCELYPDGRFPTRAGYFLWGSQGIAARATAAQMDRIRDEEIEIVRRATEAYPSVQILSSLRNLRDQILMAGIDPAMFRDKVMAAPETLVRTGNPPTMAWHVPVQLGVILLSLLVIAFRIGRVSPRLRESALLVLLGILGNDAVCAIAAAADIRYQSRLLWLIPLLAVLLLPRRTGQEPQNRADDGARAR